MWCFSFLGLVAPVHNGNVFNTRADALQQLTHPRKDHPAQKILNVNRRAFIASSAIGSLVPCFLLAATPQQSLASPSLSLSLSGFPYSSNWTATSLQIMNLEQAVHQATKQESVPNNNNNNKDANDAMAQHTPLPQKEVVIWDMGRWPDPILRRPAEPVEAHCLGTTILLQACQILQDTARINQAVGLAAQQCGVNARIIVLMLEEEEANNKLYSQHKNKNNNKWLTMINPRIVERSPEVQMRVWQEHCLVLPPTFSATVLRDAWVVVEYQMPNDPAGTWRQRRFAGELARAVQHELDHDRGILVTDHVGLEEMETDKMRSIEQIGHDKRMLVAYDRWVGVPTTATMTTASATSAITSTWTTA